mmetsp:Transcript_29873/g.82010  ORF Transcript_29873/g.82010 Transcript_29873/m.82010 type:complete len:84 (+) Transcript_29873:1222-1473(+)
MHSWSSRSGAPKANSTSGNQRAKFAAYSRQTGGKLLHPGPTADCDPTAGTQSEGCCIWLKRDTSQAKKNQQPEEEQTKKGPST